MMSEAELHQIRIRLHQGKRQKAARDELRLPLPAGLAYDRSGTIILHPDEEVQGRLRLIFAQFRELKSAKAVMRYLQKNQLLVPVRPLLGPAPQEIVWRPADSARILHILKNPAYAGAYVYGRHRYDPTRHRAGHPKSGTVRVAREDWPVCLREAHPGYIDWDEFLLNQQQLADNVNHYEARHHGLPRQGCALLQGIVVCGCCGRHMGMRYSGPQGNYPVYQCTADNTSEGRPRCQEVRSLAVDALVEQILLAALASDQLALTLAALGQMEQETQGLERQWSLKRERARYEAERARRQYDGVEPENRLVARSLERQWEEKLRQVEHIEQDYERWQREQAGPLTEADRREILSLGENLPCVWQAETTTAAERKQIVRLVIQEVTLYQKRQRGQVWMRITWQTGTISEHWLWRRVQDYRQYAEREQLEQRVRELNVVQKMDAEIAAVLNAEGFYSAQGRPFYEALVFLLRKQWRIATVKINGTYQENPLRWPDGSYSVRGAVAALQISPVTVFIWLRKGRFRAEQMAKGMPWKIWLTDEEITTIRANTRHVSSSKKEAL